ncbi:hypothetical protein KEM48_002770 [Puccinia striiformis f. sp. tritici PST-130]|nr:hypothetical protein KEM48_002770 [Puccinia striiformis f. sp. tritici PST-130]
MISLNITVKSRLTILPWQAPIPQNISGSYAKTQAWSILCLPDTTGVQTSLGETGCQGRGGQAMAQGSGTHSEATEIDGQFPDASSASALYGLYSMKLKFSQNGALTLISKPS